VFFWFIGTAIVTVGVVFRDPRFDYRLLIVGSVLPISDGILGGARALHSVTVSVALLAVLMIATSGRKPIRKLLLGLPIGMILHLVFDGAWNNTEVFWWPFFGLSFDDAPLPILDRGWWSLVLEAIGLAICWWLWRRNRLGDPGGRTEFLRTGRLDAVPDRFG
jgi:hypothetical protein